MPEVIVTPESRESALSIMAIVIILVLVFLGVFGYTQGWFSMNQAATPSPSQNINITTPAPTTPAPTTPTTNSQATF